MELKKGDVLQRVYFIDSGRSFTRYGIVQSANASGATVLAYVDPWGIYNGLWEHGTYVWTGKNVDLTTLENICKRGAE